MRKAHQDRSISFFSVEDPAKFLGALLGDFADFEGAWMEKLKHCSAA
jgi:hypothetical protein